MNKLNPFEGLVIAQEDLADLQASIEEYFVKALSITSNFPETNGKGGVALGFNLLITGPKIKVFNSNSMNLGYAMDGAGKVIEYKPISTEGVTLTPDSYVSGQTWIAAVRLIEELGTYNPETGGVDIGVSNRISLVDGIPGESGGTQPDRIIQDYKLDVFTDVAFAAEQTATGNAWIELGRFKTNGVDTNSNVPNNLSDLDTSNTTNIAGRFTQGSVTINQISNELLPFFKELLVNLDSPTIGQYDTQKNHGTFVDGSVLLTKTNGDPISIFAPEFPVPEPRVLSRRDGSFDSSPVGISDQFGNPVFSHVFTITPDNNFGMTYNPTITHVSLYVGTLDFLSPQTNVEGRILDSTQSVVASFSSSVNNLVAQSWNKFQLSSTALLAVGSSYTLQVRKSDSNSGFSIYAQTGIFAYRVWHRPAAGTYADDLKLYDEFGDLTQLSSNNDRNTSKGIVRYIPYAAVINDFSTFIPYIGNEEEIEPFRPNNSADRTYKFVAIDVQNGRFFFSNNQAPTEDVVVKCSFKQLLFNLTAGRIQRKSQSLETYYESVESALLRLERLSNPEILVKRRGSPLVKVLPVSGGLHSTENKFRFISTDSQLKDSTGTPFSSDSVNLPDPQLKIDSFYNVDTPADYQIIENYTVPRQAEITIGYVALAGPTDGDRLSINGILYEFDDNSSVGSGYVPVPILGTTDNTFAQLVSKINFTDATLLATHNVTNKEVKIQFKAIGAAGNTVAVLDTTSAVPTRYTFADYLGAPLVSSAALTGGTWGSFIPFKPKFTKHTGVVLTIKKTGNPTGFGSITVDMYAGTNYTETNINNLIKIGPTGRITSSTVTSLIVNTPTALFVNLPIDLDLTTHTDFYYKIKTDTVPVGGSLFVQVDAVTSSIGFQELFTSAPGLATSVLGYDIFDQNGSIFTPSPNRSPVVVNSISQLVFTGTGNDFQIQSTLFPLQETGTEALPSFTPPTISDIYLSSIEFLISESDTPAGEIIVTIHDENNQVVGVPQRKILPNPTISQLDVNYNQNYVTWLDVDGNVIYPPVLNSDPAPIGGVISYPGITQELHEDPANTTYRSAVQFSVPYSAILDIRKRYHVHIQTTSVSANILIGTDGVSGTGNKWMKVKTSKAYVPIYADLSDASWESVELPNAFYVAVDPFLGRVKFNDNVATGNLPPGGELTSNFNISIPFNSLSSETLIRPDGTSVEEALNNLSSNITLVNTFTNERVHDIPATPGVYALHSKDAPLTKKGIDQTQAFLPSQVSLETNPGEILLREVAAKVKDVGSGFPLQTNAIQQSFLIPSDPYGTSLELFPLGSLYLNVLDIADSSKTTTISILTSTGDPVGSPVTISNTAFIKGFENRIPLNPATMILRAGISYVINISTNSSGSITLVDDSSGNGVVDYRLFYQPPSGYYGGSPGNYVVNVGGTDVSLAEIKQWAMRYPIYGKSLNVVPFIGNDKTVGFVENIRNGAAVISMERVDHTERKFYPFEEEVIFCAPKVTFGVPSVDVISKKVPTRLGEYTVQNTDIVGDIFTLTAHGFNDGYRVLFTNPDPGLTVGGPVPGNTVFYVLYLTPDTFSLASSFGGGQLSIGAGAGPSDFEVITSNTKISHREYDYSTESWSSPTLLYEELSWKQDVNSVSVRNGQNSTTASYNKIFMAIIPYDGQSVLTTDNYGGSFSPAVAATGLTLSVGASWKDIKLHIDDHFRQVGPTVQESQKYMISMIEDNAGTETVYYAKKILIVDATFTQSSTGLTGASMLMRNLDLMVTDTGYVYALIMRNGSGGATQYRYTVVRGTDFLGQPIAWSTTPVNSANYARKSIPADHNADEIGLTAPSGYEVGKEGWRVVLDTTGPLTGAFSAASLGDLAIWSELQQAWTFHTYVNFPGVITNYRDRQVKFMGVTESGGNYTYSTIIVNGDALSSETLGLLSAVGDSATSQAPVPLNIDPVRFYRKGITLAFMNLNQTFTEARHLNIYDQRMPLPQGKLSNTDYIDPFKRYSGLGVDPVSGYIHFDYALGKSVTSTHTVSINLQNIADDFIPNARGWSDWTDELLDRDNHPQPFPSWWKFEPRVLRLDRMGVVTPNLILGTVFRDENSPYISQTVSGQDATYQVSRTKVVIGTQEWFVDGLSSTVLGLLADGMYVLALTVFPENQVSFHAIYADSMETIHEKFLTNASFYKTSVSEGIVLAEVTKTP